MCVCVGVFDFFLCVDYDVNFAVSGLPSGIGVFGGETRGGKWQALEGKGVSNVFFYFCPEDNTFISHGHAACLFFCNHRRRQ